MFGDLTASMEVGRWRVEAAAKALGERHRQRIQLKAPISDRRTRRHKRDVRWLDLLWRFLRRGTGFGDLRNVVVEHDLYGDAEIVLWPIGNSWGMKE